MLALLHIHLLKLPFILLTAVLRVEFSILELTNFTSSNTRAHPCDPALWFLP